MSKDDDVGKARDEIIDAIDAWVRSLGKKGGLELLDMLFDDIPMRVNEFDAYYGKLVTRRSITKAQIRTVQKAMLGTPRKNAYHRAIIKDCAGALAGDKACRESVAAAYRKMED